MDLKKYGSWGPKDIQSAYSIIWKMRKDGIKFLDDAITQLEIYADEMARVRKSKERKAKYERQRIKIPAVVCEGCGGPVYLEPVNITPASQTGDDSQTAIMCYDKRGCGHTSYSKKPIEKFELKFVQIKYDRKTGVKVFNDVN